MLKAGYSDALVSNKRKASVIDFFSQFHGGVGVSGWPPSYGVELFGEYRNESQELIRDYSIYLIASHGTYGQGLEWGLKFVF